MNKYGIFSIPSSERTCHVSSPVSFFRGYATVAEGRCCLGVRKNYDISLSPLKFAARTFKSIAKMIAILVLENVIVTTWCVWYTYKPSSPELSQGHSFFMYQFGVRATYKRL